MPGSPWLNRVERDFKDRDDELRAVAAKVQDTLNSPGWAVIAELVDAAHSDALERLFSAHRGGS